MQGRRAPTSWCCCRTTASTSTARWLGSVEGIDVILTGHTHDALPEVIKVGKTLLVASGSHGKFVSRLDLDVRGQGDQGLPLPPDPDLLGRDHARSPRWPALIAKHRAPYASRPEARARQDRARCSTGAATSTARSTTSSARRCWPSATPRSRCRRASAGARACCRARTSRSRTSPTHCAISYPACYRMTMTGARLKEVLEDVADNIFNPDPYYQQGGDMVRTGGLGYTDRRRASRSASASPTMTLLKTGAADRGRQGLRRSPAGRASTRAPRDRRSGRSSPSTSTARKTDRP